jgi:hypothetical protein
MNDDDRAEAFKEGYASAGIAALIEQEKEKRNNE